MVVLFCRPVVCACYTRTMAIKRTSGDPTRGPTPTCGTFSESARVHCTRVYAHEGECSFLVPPEPEPEPEPESQRCSMRSPVEGDRCVLGEGHDVLACTSAGGVIFKGEPEPEPMRCPFYSRAYDARCELPAQHEDLCVSAGDGFAGGFIPGEGETGPPAQPDRYVGDRDVQRCGSRTRVIDSLGCSLPYRHEGTCECAAGTGVNICKRPRNHDGKCMVTIHGVPSTPMEANPLHVPSAPICKARVDADHVCGLPLGHPGYCAPEDPDTIWMGVPLTPAMNEMIGKLVATGLFGTDRQKCVSELLCHRLRELANEDWFFDDD